LDSEEEKKKNSTILKTLFDLTERTLSVDSPGSCENGVRHEMRHAFNTLLPRDDVELDLGGKLSTQLWLGTEHVITCLK